jgi:hypothetical protein
MLHMGLFPTFGVSSQDWVGALQALWLPCARTQGVVVGVTIGLEGNRRDCNTMEEQRNSKVIVIY